jgi:hypothetical protein
MDARPREEDRPNEEPRLADAGDCSPGQANRGLPGRRGRYFFFAAFFFATFFFATFFFTTFFTIFAQAIVNSSS